jgi:hypothetical protein
LLQLRKEDKITIVRYKIIGLAKPQSLSSQTQSVYRNALSCCETGMIKEVLPID